VTFLRWTFKAAGVVLAYITIGEMVGAWARLGIATPRSAEQHVFRVIGMAIGAAILFGIGSACRPARRERW